MSISFVKLPGLDQEKIQAIVEPILDKHQLDGVELVWRGDEEGRLLELTIELPGSKRSGEGITVDICSVVSREIAEILDETDLIKPKYRLEVGSPGVERALYSVSDYERFAGQEAKIKLLEPSTEEGFIGRHTIRGSLVGVDKEGRVVLETDHGDVSLGLDEISSARLAFSWKQPKRKADRKPRTANSETTSRKSKRSN